MTDDWNVICRCGNVALVAGGQPVMSNECLCNSCRNAAKVFGALADGLNVADEKGASHVLIYRTDKVRCVQGATHLKEHRLSPESKTRRIIATCCNTPMFLDFEPGPWLSLYAINWREGNLPPVQYRTFCNDLDDMSVLSNDIPNGKPIPFGVARRLFWMAASTGFRTRKVTFVEGTLDV